MYSDKAHDLDGPNPLSEQKGQGVNPATQTKDQHDRTVVKIKSVSAIKTSPKYCL